MALKDTVTDDQWKQIVQTPFVAGFAVTAADPGGLIGAFQESTAMARSLRDAAETGGDGSIAKAILDELKTSDGRTTIRDAMNDLIKGQKPAQASAAAVAQVQKTLTLVAQTAPEEFAPLVELVRSTAQNVAEAAKEGGFLGFGGEPVSAAEYKTLEDIETAIATAGSGG